MTDSQSLIISQAITAGSSSAEAYELAFPTNRNKTNTGSLYVMSSATVQKTYSTQSYEVLNPTSLDLHTRGQANYWVTASVTIPSGIATFISSSLGLGPAGTTAKVSISSSYFTLSVNSDIENSNDVRGFNILPYNGVISTINGFNEFSSSTFNNYTEYFVVMYVSASKANMGGIVTSPLVISLGTSQLNSATRNGNDSTTNVSEHAAFALKYPNNTTKADWVDGISPKNR